MRKEAPCKVCDMITNLTSVKSCLGNESMTRGDIPYLKFDVKLLWGSQIREGRCHGRREKESPEMSSW